MPSLPALAAAALAADAASLADMPHSQATLDSIFLQARRAVTFHTTYTTPRNDVLIIKPNNPTVVLEITRNCPCVVSRSNKNNSRCRFVSFPSLSEQILPSWGQRSESFSLILGFPRSVENRLRDVAFSRWRWRAFSLALAGLCSRRSGCGRRPRRRPPPPTACGTTSRSPATVSKTTVTK
eukprot:COSAG06_NODE_317_length_17666_cov_51.304548_6_plen_181_part_00